MFGFKPKRRKPQTVIADDRLRHVAFIMDGNGRWAKKQGMPREYGHKAGAETFRRITGYCKDIGIKIITVYAFSTENWKRPKNEVDTIMSLLLMYIEEAIRDADINRIRFIFIGNRSFFSRTIQTQMNKLEAVTVKYNNDYILNMAINYGGRDDIVHAVNSLIASGAKSVTEDDISANLYTSHTPPPDLIIRTANERRLSNFLLWQAAYSELYFTDTLWPDLTDRDIDKAVADFYARKRRYGGI
ncbi:MAG: polyprenyl diphosphate synthase [Eubacteriales bacterium]|jgi:undecaprenyl diphosphate synthase|nr:polyprenyl diphosphate synthase [Eubacteriales bacterium]